MCLCLRVHVRNSIWEMAASGHQLCGVHALHMLTSGFALHFMQTSILIRNCLCHMMVSSIRRPGLWLLTTFACLI